MRRAALTFLTAATLALSPKLSAAEAAHAQEPSAPPSATAQVELTRIWPSWRSADSFLRISEYFGGGENRSRQTLLRSQPAERAGFYFLTRIKNPAPEALPNAQFELRVIRPEAPQPVTYTFATTLAPGSHAYLLGLTGSDWPDSPTKAAADTHPTAWALRLLDAQGRELLRTQSFLWEREP